MTRREFVIGAVGGFAATLRVSVPRMFAAPRAGASGEVKALAFDALAVFDPRPVFALADAMFPGSGLSDEWRTRQFEYTWLRAAAEHYADFWQVTEEALVYAETELKLKLGRNGRAALMNAYLELNAWPDVAPALESLIGSGFRLALLSNFTPQMLDANVHNAGLDGLFEQDDQHRSEQDLQACASCLSTWAGCPEGSARGGAIRRVCRMGRRRCEALRLSNVLAEPTAQPGRRAGRLARRIRRHVEWIS